MEIGDIKEQWQQTPPLQKFLLISIICFATLFVVYNYILMPKIEEYDNLVKEVEELDNKLSNAKLTTGNQKSIQEKIRKIEENIKNLDKKLEEYSLAIPHQPNTEEILDYITKSVSVKNLKLISYKTEDKGKVYLYYDESSDSLKEVDDGKKTEGKQTVVLKKVSITFSIVGDINGINAVLDDIKRSKRVLMFEKIDIKKEGKNLRSDITVYSYYRGG